MTKAPELKPCPFCGGTPEIEIWTEFDSSYPEPNEYQRESVSCTCGVQRNGIEAWNQRADLRPVVKALRLLERRNGYWGGKCSFGYQVAHTNGDLYRVRLNGIVLCHNIKGFERACTWANNHHRQTILSDLAPVTPAQAARELLEHTTFAEKQAMNKAGVSAMLPGGWGVSDKIVFGRGFVAALRAIAEGGA